MQEQQNEIQKELLATMLLEERTIIINQEIDDNILESVAIPIYIFNAEDNNGNEENGFKTIPIEERQPIKILINSDGGDLDPTFAVISIIQKSKTPIHTIITGRAYSAGLLLGLAGHKRYAYSTSVFLLHQGKSGIAEDLLKILDYAKFLGKRMNQVKDYVCSTTKITPRQYSNFVKKESYFLADEALKLGIIDKII